jgi:nucleoside-diphosphate-sugar epimerase
MDDEIVMFGYGPVGRATVARLVAQDRPVRVAQRSRPADLPAGVCFTPCDVLDAGSVHAAVAGAAQVVVAIGFPYVGKLWAQLWPRAMQNLLDGSAARGARMVFLDDHGRKPATRARITRMWQQDARVRVTALRAPDFYGPGVTLSHLGDTGLAAVARGKPAIFLFSPDQPHDYAYVPDIGRAIVTLLDAGDDAFGRAWHMPCAPTRSSRDILKLGAACMGAPLRLWAIPQLALDGLALVVPMLREMREMRFQWDRPYHVDASAWTARFWADVTPFAEGVAATIRSFEHQMKD